MRQTRVDIQTSGTTRVGVREIEKDSNREGDQGQAESKSQGETCQSGAVD